MRHTEGGWPKDVDHTEPQDVTRYRKKAEKDEGYKSAVKTLGPLIGRCMKQNNTVDIYEEYFEGDNSDHSGEPPSATGLAVFRDPNEVKRTATSINWHPEGTSKIAVSYSILQFQDPRAMDTSMPKNSYIWDLMNPNHPDQELSPPSPLCSLRFNPKTPDTLVGGCYNGLITFYDLRKAGSTESSLIEKSHHDPVYDVFWITSKTGNQCASVSTDGQMLWWDIRKIAQPVDCIPLKLPVDKLTNTGGDILNGSSMEYNSEAGPMKYLVGTEQGIVMQINLRNRKQNNGVHVFDTGRGKHHAPIYAIMRNPIHNKFFMTVGDWTAKVWTEDLKSPIMTTKYHSAYLTSGCWSPTRAGVFLVTRMDGVVDIWDYYYRQNEVAYSHKVGDTNLSCISVSNQGGKLVAVGDTTGTVSLLELCDSLVTSQANEKISIGNMLEREYHQEKNLEARERELKRAKDRAEENREKELAAKEIEKKKEVEMEDTLRQEDKEFLKMIRLAEDAESKEAVATGMAVSI